MDTGINLQFFILLLLWRNKRVLGLTVTVDVDDTQTCVGKNITLTCAISPFTNPTAATWNRNGSVLTTCFAGGICSTDFLVIENIKYTFSGHATQIQASFQIQHVEDYIKWNCDYNGTSYLYTFNVLDNCKTSKDSSNTGAIVGGTTGGAALLIGTGGAIYKKMKGSDEEQNEDKKDKKKDKKDEKKDSDEEQDKVEHVDENQPKHKSTDKKHQKEQND